MKTVTVDLGDRSYPIYIGRNILSQQNLISQHIHGKQIVIVTNETVAPLYLAKTKAMLNTGDLHTVILPDGEEFKNLTILNQIFDTLLENNCDRQSTLIALGGGVIGDMTGFAAACYQRGVNFIQIPTTLLAQVDSSVGGKTGVNHALGKNMIGAFYQPQCVIADTNTLNTLEDKELSAGIAEIIKYGLLGNEKFFHWLEQNMSQLLARDPDCLAYAIERSCMDKAEIVKKDEKEGGIRALLNLGHTFGHAIEAAMGYGQWLHGEAVATGMVMAASLSEKLHWINAEKYQKIEKLIKQAKLPIHAPDTMTTQQFIELMQRDKKNQGGNIRLVLLKDIGNAVISDDYEATLLLETIEQAISHNARKSSKE